MILFSGVDVVVDRRLGDDEIRECLAQATPVGKERISVIDDVANYPAQSAADIVCVVTPNPGQFSLVLSIQCEPLELPGERTADLIHQLATILEAKILMPDDGDDPYVMWLVQPNAAPKRVALDEAAFDEDRYEIRDLHGNR